MALQKGVHLGCLCQALLIAVCSFTVICASCLLPLAKILCQRTWHLPQRKTDAGQARSTSERCLHPFGAAITGQPRLSNIQKTEFYSLAVLQDRVSMIKCAVLYCRLSAVSSHGGETEGQGGRSRGGAALFMKKPLLQQGHQSIHKGGALRIQ